MSETKHTAGPWRAVHNGYYWEIRSDECGQVGDACASQYHGKTDDGDVPSSPELAEANAKLMALAPTLLEALKTIIAADDSYRAHLPGGADKDPLSLACDAARRLVFVAEAGNV